MRTLLIASLALSSLAPIAHDAEACGGYFPEPAALQLTTHAAPFGARSFVRLAPRATAPDGVSWSRLARLDSFDATEISRAPALASPMTFTLIGPSGARIVTSKQHVFLRRWHDDVTSALEVAVRPDERFTLALTGAHTDAKWIAVDYLDTRRKPVKWLAANGVTATPEAISVSRLHGSDLELLYVYDAKHAKTVTYVKQGDRNLGMFEGEVVGAYTSRGAKLLVMSRDRGYTSVYLDAA